MDTFSLDQVNVTTIRDVQAHLTCLVQSGKIHLSPETYQRIKTDSADTDAYETWLTFKDWDGKYAATPFMDGLHVSRRIDAPLEAEDMFKITVGHETSVSNETHELYKQIKSMPNVQPDSAYDASLQRAIRDSTTCTAHSIDSFIRVLFDFGTFSYDTLTYKFVCNLLKACLAQHYVFGAYLCIQWMNQYPRRVVLSDSERAQVRANLLDEWTTFTMIAATFRGDEYIQWCDDRMWFMWLIVMRDWISDCITDTWLNGLYIGEHELISEEVSQQILSNVILQCVRRDHIVGAFVGQNSIWFQAVIECMRLSFVDTMFRNANQIGDQKTRELICKHALEKLNGFFSDTFQRTYNDDGMHADETTRSNAALQRVLNQVSHTLEKKNECLQFGAKITKQLSALDPLAYEDDIDDINGVNIHNVTLMKKRIDDAFATFVRDDENKSDASNVSQTMSKCVGIIKSFLVEPTNAGLIAILKLLYMYRFTMWGEWIRVLMCLPPIISVWLLPCSMHEDVYATDRARMYTEMYDAHPMSRVEGLLQFFATSRTLQLDWDNFLPLRILGMLPYSCVHTHFYSLTTGNWSRWFANTIDSFERSRAVRANVHLSHLPYWKAHGNDVHTIQPDTKIRYVTSELLDDDEIMSRLQISTHAICATTCLPYVVWQPNNYSQPQWFVYARKSQASMSREKQISELYFYIFNNKSHVINRELIYLLIRMGTFSCLELAFQHLQTSLIDDKTWKEWMTLSWILADITLHNEAMERWRIQCLIVNMYMQTNGTTFTSSQCRMMFEAVADSCSFLSHHTRRTRADRYLHNLIVKTTLQDWKLWTLEKYAIDYKNAKKIFELCSVYGWNETWMALLEATSIHSSLVARNSAFFSDRLATWAIKHGNMMLVEYSTRKFVSRLTYETCLTLFWIPCTATQNRIICNIARSMKTLEVLYIAWAMIGSNQSLHPSWKRADLMRSTKICFVGHEKMLLMLQNNILRESNTDACWQTSTFFDDTKNRTKMRSTPNISRWIQNNAPTLRLFFTQLQKMNLTTFHTIASYMILSHMFLVRKK